MYVMLYLFFFFFFFKQKTAYEMDGWLEFRRVLFRSHRVLLPVRALQEALFAPRPYTRCRSADQLCAPSQNQQPPHPGRPRTKGIFLVRSADALSVAGG